MTDQAGDAKDKPLGKASDFPPEVLRLFDQYVHNQAIKARLLLHFADHDERINATWPPYEAALKAAHVHYEAFTYPGTEHGFNNDTTPRYDAKAARMAWMRTIVFLDEFR